MTRFISRSLGLLAVCALGACIASDETQTVTGRVDRGGFSGVVLGARAVTGAEVVATAPVNADDRFTLAIPVGTGYRVEIITSTGAQPIVARASGTVVHFDVCAPSAPYDLGEVFQGDAWPNCTDPNADGTCDDPTDPEPPTCDAATGADCACTDPNADGTCGCDAVTGIGCGCTDPNADGTCDDPTDPEPPACDPGSGADCGCSDPNADGTCDDPTEPPACDPATGADCGCRDPNADGTCDDPTVPEPGCDPATCWPPPPEQPCDASGVCDPGDCAVPEQDLPDFGCERW